MALKSTIYKANLSIANMDSHYYADHTLTIAKHPSETDRRMMLRILAFALYANDQLHFCKGLSTDDEPALWQLDDIGAITLWIELGLPDLKRLKKACSRAEQVVLLCYGDNATAAWWSQQQSSVAALENLTILQILDAELTQLSQLAQRSMNLTFSAQDKHWMITDQNQLVALELGCLKP